MRVLVVITCVFLSEAATFPIRLDRRAEVVAELRMRSPGADFAKPGREAAVAALSLPGGPTHYVTLFAGADSHSYPVFLGELPAGEHVLRVERDPQRSAPGADLQVESVRFLEYRPGDADYLPIAHAPVLYARPDTAGRFSDVPLLVYCERLEEDGRPVLQYTAIFSNEDGGTSTRALMARWGRTTDIEWIYRVYLTPDGRPERAVIQTKDHKEVEFAGQREGRHPLLYVITENNMVGDSGSAAMRYQLAPRLVDLSNASRERVMDEEPVLYRVAAQELEREGKLRAFGSVAGENISDPRNYLYLEMKLATRDAAVGVRVRLQGERRWRASHLGRLDYAIGRSGWVRTTVELPPGATLDRIAEVGLECLLTPRHVNGKEIWPDQGHCRVEQLGQVFRLDAQYKPHRVARLLSAELRAGEMVTFDW